MYLRVIACEVLVREVCHLAATSPHTVDVEFVPHGLHDNPQKGQREIQQRVETVPAGKYDAILLGYGLCGSILTGVRAAHTQLVVPRAHDCITFFLGSRRRYSECFNSRPGSYYFTSGWLECRRRRGDAATGGYGGFFPAHSAAVRQELYSKWTAKYGEEQAKYLMETMAQWADNYTHGVLIDFDFTRPLALAEQVRAICADRGWQYDEIAGDLGLLKRWLDGEWDRDDFLVVPPGRGITAESDESVVGLDTQRIIRHALGATPAAEPKKSQTGGIV